MSKILKFCFAVVAILVLSGCFHIPTPAERIAASQYPSLTKAYYDAKFSMDINEPNRIVISKFMPDIYGPATSLDGAFNKYLSKYDAANDDIARVFIANAKLNGNSVKIYKKSLNELVVRALPVIWELNNNPSRIDMDVVFIEFDRDGRMLAALYRAHYYTQSLAINDYLASFVVFGNLVSNIEYNVGNYALENAFIREIK